MAPRCAGPALGAAGMARASPAATWDDLTHPGAHARGTGVVVGAQGGGGTTSALCVQMAPVQVRVGPFSTLGFKYLNSTLPILGLWMSLPWGWPM